MKQVSQGLSFLFLLVCQTAVSAYQFPFDDGGWNSPTKSMEMNSMGCAPGLKGLFYELSLLYPMFCAL